MRAIYATICQMIETEEPYIFPPSEQEAKHALWQEAIVVFKFHVDRRMTVEKRRQEIDKALAPLEQATKTEKYSLGELKELAARSPDERMRLLYQHEADHARQMDKVLIDMGITTKAEYDVYFCPILADMYQHGMFIGLLEMREAEGLQFTREQAIEFDRRFAIEMLKSRQNSIGDLFLIFSVMGARLASVFTK